jgi:hypothetical protein
MNVTYFDTKNLKSRIDTKQMVYADTKSQNKAFSFILSVLPFSTLQDFETKHSNLDLTTHTANTFKSDEDPTFNQNDVNVLNINAFRELTEFLKIVLTKSDYASLKNDYNYDLTPLLNS